LEEKSYQEELKGKEKVKESTSVLVESRKLLKRKYGRVYVSYNKPFTLKDVEKEIGKSENTTSIVANNIVRKISEVAVVTPFALSTLAMMLLSVKGFSKKMLLNEIENLYNFLDQLNVQLSSTLQRKSNFGQIVDYVIDSYLSDNIIEEITTENSEDENSEIFYMLREENRARIGFYKNSIIHYFVPLAYYSLALLHKHRPGSSINRKELNKEYEFIEELFSMEYIYSKDDIGNGLNIEDKIIGYMEREGLVKTNRKEIELIPDKIDLLKFYAKIIQDCFESYMIVSTTLLDVSAKIEKKPLVKEIRKNGMKMLKMGDVKLAESLSQPNYNNALGKFVGEGVLLEEAIDRRRVQFEIVDMNRIRETSERLRGYLKNLG